MYLVSYTLVALCLAAGRLSQRTGDGALKSGNYEIHLCDEKEPAVKALLDRLYYGIQQAHEDMDSAEPGGSPAYRTFLGGVNPNNVRSLFSQIAAGSNLEFNGGRFHPPEIACVHPRHKSLMPRQWAHCSDGAREGVAAMWEKSTHSIFLCPYFWIFPSSPTEDKCPQVVQAGTRFDKSNIIETQMNVLFHELLHLHMGYPMLEPEAYGINKCANLPPHLSVINVSNYDYYLGFLIAGCSRFPTFPNHGQHWRNLLYEDTSSIYKGENFKAGNCADEPFLARLGRCS